jgi:formylglycine-generating enzyme required for sulfatase activity
LPDRLLNFRFWSNPDLLGKPIHYAEDEGEDYLPGDDDPVLRVDWEDIQAYCAWSRARLPTEAEWEYAARGSQARRFPWGDDPPNASYLNYGSRDSAQNDGWSYTAPVGSFREGASQIGCMDMAGNVGEMVQDRYAPLPEHGPLIDPVGPPSGELRVMRGGDWMESLDVLYMTTFRTGLELDEHLPNARYGFRIALDPR